MSHGQQYKEKPLNSAQTFDIDVPMASMLLLPMVYYGERKYVLKIPLKCHSYLRYLTGCISTMDGERVMSDDICCIKSCWVMGKHNLSGFVSEHSIDTLGIDICGLSLGESS